MIKKHGIKIGIIIISISILIILIGNYVYASSFKCNIYATKTKVKPGEETNVIIKISDIVDVNDLGINALEAVLEYDSNIFEIITPSDMEGKNNWTITFNQQEGNFLVSNITSGVKSEQEIGQIKFKVKKNVGKTKTKIYFKQIKSNDGNKLIYEQNKEVEIIIDLDEEKEESIISSTDNIGSTAKDLETTVKKVNDTAVGNLPQTGEANILIAILAIAILGTISYIRYRKLQIK